MTSTVSLKTTDYGVTYVHVNGRRVRRSIYRITEIRRVSKSRIEGVASGEPFTIVGGRHAGGLPNEWFLEWTPASGAGVIYTTSIADSIKQIEGA